VLACLGERNPRLRGAFLDVARQLTPYVGVETSTGVYVVHTHDKSIGPSLFVTRERTEMHVLRRALDALEHAGAERPAGTLVDAGANIGTTTVSALLALGFQSAVAVEPAPDNLRLLRANVALNGLDQRVTTIAAALADEEGEAALYLAPANFGGHRIMPVDDAWSRKRRHVSVRVSTLDALAAGGEIDPGRVGLLWMDIEGHEARALLAASALLERGVPVVMELNPGKLAGGGRVEELVPALEAHYTHILDVRGKWPDDRPTFRPVSDLAALATPGAVKLTDLLICRLP
jgi:FkbM family methyltransferase